MLLILLFFKISDWAHVGIDYRDPQNASFSLYELLLAYLTFIQKIPNKTKNL
jgi:hypothetical protein